MVTRRTLFQALGGLVVAGTASAGVMNPYTYETTNAGWLHPKQAQMPRDAHCPICKQPICYVRTRMTEVAPKDNTRMYEIVGLVYFHRDIAGVCDLPL